MLLLYIYKVNSRCAILNKRQLHLSFLNPVSLGQLFEAKMDLFDTLSIKARVSPYILSLIIK